MLVAAAWSAVIAFAVYALARTPQAERRDVRPVPRAVAGGPLALPAAVIVAFVAPHPAAFAALAATVAWLRDRAVRESRRSSRAR